MDAIPERRGGLVAGRLPAPRDAAIGRGAVADDDPARLVRVLGPGVIDELLDDRGRQLDGRGAG